MRGTQLWKHQTGAGARNDDMDNTCELLINVFRVDAPYQTHPPTDPYVSN
ncbi:hypothetical protein [Desulfonema limicola]|nr:hypothetical protein [Desulfonema limicola]